MASIYVYHRISTKPLQWRTVANAVAASASAAWADTGGSLYGVWRSQIGLPRDELTAVSYWLDARAAVDASAKFLDGLDGVQKHSAKAMSPTLRPRDEEAPTRQGNYAFRQFTTPPANWDEFLSLCASAWLGFESSYDSQVIGLWRFADAVGDDIHSLLLTRRPDLAMWERSKIPADAEEAEVRRKLSRRYDLCTSTVVYTTTLLTASDVEDTARWT